MNITTKYSIGQKLYILDFSRLWLDGGSVQCSNCHGDYERHENGGVWTCSKCNNGYTKGKRRSSYTAHQYGKVFEVLKIDICISGDNQEEIVHAGMHDYSQIYFQFKVGELDVLNDLWGDNHYSNQYTSVGIPVVHVHTSETDAMIELERVKREVEKLDNKLGCNENHQGGDCSDCVVLNCTFRSF